jgi:AbrB family looped-hinge helix DNA binding protein
MVYAITNGMTVKIDKVDRIVLPEPVRERFHLREGAELELEERPDGLTLRTIEKRPSMVLGAASRSSGARCLADLIGMTQSMPHEKNAARTLRGMKAYFDTAVMVAESVSDHPHRG